MRTATKIIDVCKPIIFAMSVGVATDHASNYMPNLKPGAGIPVGLALGAIHVKWPRVQLGISTAIIIANATYQVAISIDEDAFDNFPEGSWPPQIFCRLNKN